MTMSNSPSHINTNTSFGITEDGPLYNYDQGHNTNIAILSGGATVEEFELFLDLGVEHPSPLTSMATLASTFWNQGRWKEAEELQAKELDICSRVLGKEHPFTLTSMANLASTFWNQGRWKEAEELEVQVIETRKRVLGQEHPSTLTSMANLAFT
jgi:hypothetical protein